MKKLLQSISYILLGSLFSSCSISREFGAIMTHKPYRLGADLGSKKAVEEIIRKNAPPAYLGFLEFDDQGQPWRKRDTNGQALGTSQLTRVLGQLDKELKKGPVKVIVFVHGWQHSASPKNEKSGNLANFKQALRSFKTSGNERLFGVYVSWRGKSYPVPTFVDVGSREASAARVGGAPLLSALQAISTKTHRSRPSNRMITIGHSFGAKILAQVTAQSLATQVGEVRGGGSSSLRPLADTVILANTAEDAMIPRQLIGLFNDYKIKYLNEGNGRELPLVVAISSETDRLVKFGIPSWNFLTRNGFGLPSKGGATSYPAQARSLNRAMAYDPALISHRLYDSGVIREYQELDPEDQGSLIHLNSRLGSQSNLPEGTALRLALLNEDTLCCPHTYEVIEDHREATKKGVTRNDTPFWIMQVPPHVINGHGDIWNPNFIGLITALDSMNHPPSSSGRTHKSPKMKSLLK